MHLTNHILFGIITETTLQQNAKQYIKMKAQLKNIAVIQLGYSFRSRIKNENDGNISVIQMKDLLQNNTVNCNDLIKVQMEKVKEHHFAYKNDLIFRSRGLMTTTAILQENPGTAVIAAPLFRIRIKNPDKILPEYLSWFINQNEAQRYLKSRQEGTHAGMVNRKELEQLPICIPSIRKQKIILELAKLSERESALLFELSNKKSKYTSQLLMKFAKGD